MLGPADPIAFLLSLRQSRQARAAMFGTHLFADPAWDMLLELTLAGFEERQVTVKIAQGAAMVPSATSIRWIGLLVDEGLVVRRGDPLDRRRVIVALSENGWQSMLTWLEATLPGYQRPPMRQVA